jgi:hypothetical protein
MEIHVLYLMPAMLAAFFWGVCAERWVRRWRCRHAMNVLRFSDEQRRLIESVNWACEFGERFLPRGERPKNP